MCWTQTLDRPSRYGAIALSACPCKVVGGGPAFDEIVASPVFTGLNRQLPLLQLLYKDGCDVPSHVAFSCVPVQNAASDLLRKKQKKYFPFL